MALIPYFSPLRVLLGRLFRGKFGRSLVRMSFPICPHFRRVIIRILAKAPPTQDSDEIDDLEEYLTLVLPGIDSSKVSTDEHFSTLSTLGIST